MVGRVRLVLACAVMMAAGEGHAQDRTGSAACERAWRVDDVADQIRLHSMCIQRGGSRATIANAYIGRGFAHFDMGDWEAAVSDFSTSIERVVATGDNYLNPAQVAGIRINRAQAYVMMGDLDAAEADLIYAIEAQSNRSVAYGVLGRVKAMRGDEQGALADFDAALEFDSSASAQHYKAFLLATAEDPNVRNPDEAIRLAERILDDDDESIAAHRVLAAAYAELGRFEEAVYWQSAAIDLDAEIADDAGISPSDTLSAQLARLQAGGILRGAPF